MHRLESVTHVGQRALHDDAHRIVEVRALHLDLQVDRLAARLAGRRLTLTVTAAAREWLALTGFDPVYGARPLRRLVQTAVGDQLARSLLSGEIGDGDEVVVDVDQARDALSVTRAERAEAAR